jgi:hypothetical protein
VGTTGRTRGAEETDVQLPPPVATVAALAPLQARPPGFRASLPGSSTGAARPRARPRGAALGCALVRGRPGLA